MLKKKTSFTWNSRLIEYPYFLFTVLSFVPLLLLAQPRSRCGRLQKRLVSGAPESGHRTLATEATDSPLVGLDVVRLHLLQVAAQVVLQRAEERAVLVHQLGGPRLVGEPVHH